MTSYHSSDSKHIQLTKTQAKYATPTANSDLEYNSSKGTKYTVDFGDADRTFSFEATKQPDSTEDLSLLNTSYMLMPPLHSRTPSPSSQYFLDSPSNCSSVPFSNREFQPTTSTHTPAVGTIMSISEKLRSLVSRRDNNSLSHRRGSDNFSKFSKIGGEEMLADPSTSANQTDKQQDRPQISLFTEVYDGTQPSSLFERSRTSLKNNNQPQTTKSADETSSTAQPIFECASKKLSQLLANVTPDKNDNFKIELVKLRPMKTGLIGGCRKCGQTFTDRLEFIHHIVDHFPTVFYTFESLDKTDSTQLLKKDVEISTTNSIRKEGINVAHSSRKEDDCTAHSSRKYSNSKTISTSNAANKSIIKVENVKDDTDEDLPYYMCPHCCLTFLETHCFEDHLATHVNGNLEESKNACDICGLQCNNKYLLSEHKQMHSKKCDMCNEVFTTLFDLNLHIGEHLDYPYNCKDCGKCFPTRKSLAEHNKIHRIVENLEEAEEIKPHSSKSLNLSISHGGCSNRTRKLKNTSKQDQCNRPESLLNSNLYFKSLSKEPCRKRRSRAAKAMKTVGKPDSISNNTFEMMVSLSNKLFQQLMEHDENAV
ncbi:unnamed protein product [Bursaphelenchus okinawaensis]|uniref:C2H2-type domain-containing protein n=1 Tax=Bursaphelenchus okinawaensis TaxID=465554 RepID=A0A811KAQ1_9BILA|nr:unnamed protein product [Bursaphelenchus okinawaensis]CAG9099548.1 unnamed protein product [Bursaphelenchus okinawaensis]